MKEILNIDILDFTFANYKKTGAPIRDIIISIMREKDLSLKDVARGAGLKYITFLGYMNEKIVSMSFKNMNILRRYILKNYKN